MNYKIIKKYVTIKPSFCAYLSMNTLQLKKEMIYLLDNSNDYTLLEVQKITGAMQKDLQLIMNQILIDPLQHF